MLKIDREVTIVPTCGGSHHGGPTGRVPTDDVNYFRRYFVGRQIRVEKIPLDLFGIVFAKVQIVSPPDIRSVTGARSRKGPSNNEHLCIVDNVAAQAMVWTARPRLCRIPFDPGEGRERKNVDVVETCGIFCKSSPTVEINIV